MAIFLNQKVTAYGKKVTAYVRSENSKSHGAIIDILSNISDNKYRHINRRNGGMA